MFRYKFTIEYHGDAAEAGWQSQPDRISIQSILSDAAEKFCQQKIVFHGAGRTDKGVHAYAQVAHADFTIKYSLQNLKRGLNFYLFDQKVSITNVQCVDQDFHARFSAKLKRYRYDLCIRDYPNVLNTQNWRMHTKLDLNLMKKSAEFLLGEHDFTSFMDSQCQAAPVRSIDKIYFECQKDMISIFFIAQSFLHHQVRIIVGTLVDVGKGKVHYDIRPILEAKLRCKASITAPAAGLFLENINYDESSEFAG